MLQINETTKQVLKSLRHPCIYVSAVILLFLASLYLYPKQTNVDQKSPDMSLPTVAGTFTEGNSREKFCTDENLHLYNLDDLVKNNKGAVQLIKDRCLWVIETSYFDITGDGKDEIILNTSGAGCGSCHWRNILVINDSSLIFEAEGEDLSFRKLNSKRGFEIKEAIRLPKESYCCPSKGIVKVYKLSDKTVMPLFLLDDVYTERY